MNDWIDTKAKVARQKGIEGVGRKKIPIHARRVKSPCKITCRFKCQSIITQQDRENFFEIFWALEGNQDKWNFIDKWTTSLVPRTKSQPSDSENSEGEQEQRSRKKKPKSVSHQYYLPVKRNEIEES